MAGEFSTAGTKFTINETIITGLSTYPDMGSDPAKIDVSSMDDTVNKRYIDGLQDITSYVFEFNNQTTNLSDAKTSETNASNTYSLELPDGSKFAWSGSHKAYISGGSVGNPVKFKISCSINSRLEYTAGSGVA
jgi:hypothetical protein